MLHRVVTQFSSFLCVLACAAAALGQQASSITLRSTVVVQPGQPLMLADVARLEGPEASSLESTPIELAPHAADAAGWRKIDAQFVRDVLARGDARWGAIELRGGPCYVRIEAAEPQTDQAEAQESFSLSTPALPGTVRQLAENHIARSLRIRPLDVDVRWTSATQGLLDHPTAGTLADIDDSGKSDRMSLRITLYDHEANVVFEGEAKAEVRVRREVAVLTQDVPRRRKVSAEDITIERRWMDATTRVAEPSSVVGRETVTGLKAGAVVGPSDVHTAVAVERGDRVQVRIITPTVTAKLWARALADGRPGETIEFESLAPSRRDRLRFDARVDGAGSAVAVAGATRP